MISPHHAEIIAKARVLRRADPKTWSWGALARHFNVTNHWLRRRIDEAYASRFITEYSSPKGDRGKRAMTLDQIRRHRANIKPDMRTLTGRLMGDPQPDRSALAMKQRAGAQ